MPKFVAILAAGGLLACAGLAQAGTARLILESNENRGPGDELFQLSYPSYED